MHTVPLHPVFHHYAQTYRHTDKQTDNQTDGLVKHRLGLGQVKSQQLIEKSH